MLMIPMSIGGSWKGAGGSGSDGADQPAYNKKKIWHWVCNALNVLMAMDILSKEKKEDHVEGYAKQSYSLFGDVVEQERPVP